MSLSVKPDGSISGENPVVLTFMPFSWVSKTCVFYTLMFCTWSALIKLLMCHNLLLKLSICDKFLNLATTRVTQSKRCTVRPGIGKTTISLTKKS